MDIRIKCIFTKRVNIKFINLIILNEIICYLSSNILIGKIKYFDIISHFSFKYPVKIE